MNDMFDVHQSEWEVECALNISSLSSHFKYSVPETYQKKCARHILFLFLLFSIELCICTWLISSEFK